MESSYLRLYGVNSGNGLSSETDGAIVGTREGNDRHIARGDREVRG